MAPGVLTFVLHHMADDSSANPARQIQHRWKDNSLADLVSCCRRTGTWHSFRCAGTILDDAMDPCPKLLVPYPPKCLCSQVSMPWPHQQYESCSAKPTDPRADVNALVTRVCCALTRRCRRASHISISYSTAISTDKIINPSPSQAQPATCNGATLAASRNALRQTQRRHLTHSRTSQPCRSSSEKRATKTIRQARRPL
ncbi:hypothetical protein EV126DRAFT_68525 [Verticillium dahliae]|nr:hypothetical protein EV126DRAFT_68525 [Verticillium dahliae]